jgi:hypothetical protein
VVKVAVVDIDAAFVEVGSVEVAVAVDQSAGETGVAGSIGRFDGDDGMDGGSSGAGRNGDVRVPPGDCAVEGSEEKAGGKTAREDEVGGDAVEDCSGGVPVGKVLLLGSTLGMVTIREFLTPAPLKRVLRPVEIYQGLEELRDRPQGLTRVGSVTGATPEVLETRLT